MRAGFFISAVSHVVLVALALLGTPKLFNNVSISAIEVDLVRPDEVEPPKEKAPDEKKPPDEKQSPWTTLSGDLEPWPEDAPQAQVNPPDVSRQTALGPQIPSPSPEPQTRAPSIFDPANIPALLDLPTSPDKGFDSESTTTADLTDDDKAAFKAHLKKCWRLPDGMTASQTTRVVLRVRLRRDGGLASEPLLIEGPASRDGPPLLQAAARALKECQPYGFLPADRYSEWRVLDLSFSPREMAGG